MARNVKLLYNAEHISPPSRVSKSFLAKHTLTSFSPTFFYPPHLASFQHLQQVRSASTAQAAAPNQVFKAAAGLTGLTFVGTGKTHHKTNSNSIHCVLQQTRGHDGAVLLLHRPHQYGRAGGTLSMSFRTCVKFGTQVQSTLY